MAGTGPVEAELRALAEREAAGRVRFLGHLDRADLVRRLGEVRAVVLPSEWYENAPMSALEASASGRAVVASDLGGLPEIVEDGVTGLTFPAGDGAALAAALRRLHDSPQQALAFGREGRRRTESRFSLAGQARAMLDLFEEVT